jgi:ribosomal protein L24
MSQFKYDLFISYAHNDDEPDHWVSELTSNLSQSLKKRAGVRGKIKAWCDKDLDHSEEVTQQLLDSVRNSAILVSILSPSFIKSEWCTKEVYEFLSESRKRKRTTLPIYILEIYKTRRKNRPEIFRDREPIKFWVFDEETDADHPIGFPLSKNLDSPEKLQFLKHVSGLASKIVRKLKTLDKLYDEKNEIYVEEVAIEKTSIKNGTDDEKIMEKVFINSENLDLHIAKRVKNKIEKKGHKAFLPSIVSTQNAQYQLSKNYSNCLAAILIALSDNEDWLVAQLYNLKKCIVMRKRPLDFLWLLTQEKETWLIDFLNFLKTNFPEVPEKKIICFKGTKMHEILPINR